MNPGLEAPVLQRPQPVRIGVSSQEGGLEEQQADAPHSGRASKPGQEKPAQDGLYLEQQKGAKENRYGEGNPVHR
jgi:hypothetical protein